VLAKERRVLAIEDIGHSDWFRWISSTGSQALANGWKSLNQYVAAMTQRREDMAILLLVDSEQKRRNEVAPTTLVSRGHGEKLLHIQTSTKKLVDSLDNMLVLHAADTIAALDVMKVVSPLATQPELAELSYIAELNDRAKLFLVIELTSLLHRLNSCLRKLAVL
jgi:hypothetical protein